MSCCVWEIISDVAFQQSIHQQSPCQLWCQCEYLQACFQQIDSCFNSYKQQIALFCYTLIETCIGPYTPFPSPRGALAVLQRKEETEAHGQEIGGIREKWKNFAYKTCSKKLSIPLKILLFLSSHTPTNRKITHVIKLLPCHQKESVLESPHSKSDRAYLLCTHATPNKLKYQTPNREGESKLIIP